jgi:hypothetical protein
MSSRTQSPGPYFYIVILIATGALALVATAAAYYSHFTEISTEHSHWAEFGSYFGGLGGTIIAALALAALAVSVRLQLQQLALDRERHEAELLLAEIDENYRRSFESLAANASDGLPNNSRLAWLSAARLILVADGLSRKLPAAYQPILISKQLYWRFKFFDLLEPLDKAGEDFWAESLERFLGWRPGERAPISEQSAKVIHDWIFADWPDPMEDQPRFTSDEIDRLYKFRWRGLGSLLKKIRDKRG